MESFGQKIFFFVTTGPLTRTGVLYTRVRYFSNANPGSVMQLLLDASVLPTVISAVQLHGNFVRDRLLYFDSTWCYNMHRERLKYKKSRAEDTKLTFFVNL